MNGEFKYEKTIRLDEERIARYFDNLSLFMDLPGENEAIFERISKVGSEKCCKCVSPERLRQMSPIWDLADEDGQEDEYGHFESGFFRSDEYEIADMLDGLAVFYSELFALRDNAELNSVYLKIICQCGKTLGRISDLLFVPDDDNDMKNALAKRALSDLNDLAGMIAELADHGHSCDVRYELDVLQIIRKKVLDMLFEDEKD